jgi:hypothetical protein
MLNNSKIKKQVEDDAEKRKKLFIDSLCGGNAEMEGLVVLRESKCRLV